MQNLIQRSISAVVFVALFLFTIIFSSKTYLGLILVFALICLWEFSKIINLKNIIPYILLPIPTLYFSYIALNSTILFFLVITLISSVVLLYYLFTLKVFPIKKHIHKLILCVQYIILPFTFLALLPFVNGIYTPKLIISVIVLIWTNDSFAYLVGRKIGKNKLFKSVSPKKTIEGFIGGLVFSVLVSIIIGSFVNIFSLLNWVIIAIIVSSFGTLGDLIESKFKRQANIKDSGKIMPGHGGLLDRLDSLYFLAPFLYFYIHFLIN
ncbi:MAG: phosphatidate cytidylyltransferase [Tenacibaculum sp.]|nr:phosphatidate cytidylyltransferase [Tenacibaculum sp.]